jgi:hypothetical protein|uniref:Uncharacterized protein n=1 Tax=Siphoviridae sp. ct6bb17 TaxID=2825345 RepID=A0A8S5NY46_9CAUD|nr:MAG TPA: hypothetical protein [Siphoviridae sp. ct6bb17]
MRLIDEDITIKELNDKIAKLDAKQQIYMENGLTSIADTTARKIELYIECRELLEHQPTAYDADKVLEQLEYSRVPNTGIAGYHKVVEIVKGGGIDGVHIRN